MVKTKMRVIRKGLAVFLGIAVTIFISACMNQNSSTDENAADRAVTATEYRCVGYFPSWGLDSGRELSPSEIQYNKLTHVNFAFLCVNTNGTLKSLTSTEIATMQSVISNAHSAGIKVLIAVGGASNSANMISAVSSYSTKLVSNLKSFMNTYGFDGIDIDCEGLTSSSQGTKFNTFMQKLYNSIHSSGKLITSAIDDGSWYGTYIPLVPSPTWILPI